MFGFDPLDPMNGTEKTLVVALFAVGLTIAWVAVAVTLMTGGG